MVALALPILYFGWVIARKAVRWGFFLLYGLIGFGVMFVLSKLYPGAPQQLWAQIFAAVSFASICMAVQSRIMRVVGAIIVVVLGYVAAHFFAGQIR